MTYVYIVAAIVILGFVYLMRKSAKVISDMENNSAIAIIQAKDNHDIDLDLSIESLKRLNELLQILHETRKSDGENTAMIYGAYIGEVLRKNIASGFWVKDHLENGNDTFPVKFPEGLYAFPVVWVEKQLSNGEQDSILHKYSAWKSSYDCLRET